MGAGPSHVSPGAPLRVSAFSPSSWALWWDGPSVGKAQGSTPPTRVRSSGPGGLAVALTATSAEVRLRLASSALSTWAEADPEGALAWNRQLPPGRMRSETLGSVLAALAQERPERALSLAMGEKGGARREYVSAVVTSWARRDPIGAAAVLGTKGMRVDDEVWGEVAGAWAAKDAEAALKWSEQLGTLKARGLACEGVVKAVAADDPKRALGLALQVPTRVK